MKRRLLVLSLIACALGGNAIAQQDRAMTHFMYEKMTVNPGSTGINILNGFCGTAIYRNQWDKVNGAPNSAVLNVEGNIDMIATGTGVGISFYHDAIGYTRQNTAVLNYSHHFALPGALLGVGVGLGITNLGMTPEWVPPVTLNDNSLPVAFSKTKFDANFGLFLKAEAGFYVGLSSTHIPGGLFDDGSIVPTGLSSARHYYLMGGHTIRDIVEGDNLEMNLFVRTDLVKTSFDVNVRYFWKNKLYGGLTYRLSDAVGIMAGVNLYELMGKNVHTISSRAQKDALTIGYSYDISIHKLSSVSTGSHEMFVKYCMFIPPVPITKSKHPRWL